MTMRMVTLAGWVTAALLCLNLATTLPAGAIGTYDQGAAAGHLGEVNRFSTTSP